MSDPLPFRISRDAGQFIRDKFQPQPEKEAVLVQAVNYEERDPTGKVLFRFPGEYLIAAYFKPGQRPNAVYIDLFGVTVSVLPQTLDRLRGKTLTLKNVTARGGVKSQFLVAEESTLVSKRFLRKFLITTVVLLIVAGGAWATWKFAF